MEPLAIRLSVRSFLRDPVRSRSASVRARLVSVHG
jgi:hypothetical protein